MVLGPVPSSGVVGQAFRKKTPIYVPDVRKEPDYIPAPGIPTRSELALPLLEKGQVVAVLNLERPRAFLPEEVDGLCRLAQAVSQALGRMADLWTQQTLTDLSLRLQQSREMKDAAELALHYLMETLGLEAGALWEAQGGRMELLAYQGTEALRLTEIPYGQGLTWQVYFSQKARYTEEYAQEPQGIPVLQSQGLKAIAALPLVAPGTPRARRVLTLGSRTPRVWSPAEQEMPELAARFIGLALEAQAEKARHEAVGELFLSLATKQQEMSELYTQLLRTAIRWVPGSEAGSLLTLDQEKGIYRYQVVLGNDAKELQTLTYSTADQVRWYGQSRAHALRGEPRILSNLNGSVAEVSGQIAQAQVFQMTGRVAEIQSNLCLPLPHQGEVLAYLNLDNLHDPLAFGADSLEAARFFAPPLATLLREAQTRKRLEEAALTDPLTGLANRRAFEISLQQELTRAQRYRYPLSLLVLDLQSFKSINDQQGHAQGDWALQQVAQALRDGRGADRTFRWGGDEFAILLPHISKEGALAAAFRYAQAIQALGLQVNIGVATYPEEAVLPDALLRLADNRMYQAKAQRQPVLLEGASE